MTASGSNELPFGKSLNGVKGAVVKGWQLNGTGFYQTGLPLTISASTGENKQLYVTTDRPNISYADGPVILKHAVTTSSGTKEYINLKAFSAQTVGTLGNERMNQLFTLPDRRIDFSKPRSGGGSLLHLRKTPLSWRSVAHFCSGAYKNA